MKLPTLTSLSEGLRTTVLRFPVPTLFAAITTGLLVASVDDGFSDSHYFRFAFLIGLGFVAMAARRYSERHFDMSAMLRCLGATQQDLLGLYLVQLAVLGLLASAAGCLFGWLAQQGLLMLLAGLLPMAPSATSVWPVLAGLATGVVVLAGFALPPVLRLRGVPPLRVLRRDLTPLPSNAWLVYGLAIAAVILLMWRYTGNAKLTLAVLAGGAAASVILALLGLVLLALGRRVHAQAGVAWRFGLNNLWRRRGTSVSQILAFGLALLAMAVIGLVRTDLLTIWENQLPDDVPNHFAINILPEQYRPKAVSSSLLILGAVAVGLSLLLIPAFMASSRAKAKAEGE